ncbi:spermine oxidase-like [Babylonia areolata]|uniref:spermine oxidase-like n=1 Tax=Babylonia areolata TaxID=304850 RepID=UPI003FD5015E
MEARRNEGADDPTVPHANTGADANRPQAARVVVVGAGVAGVGAAGTLFVGGLRDVIVLEAADRPGGRVQNAVLDEGFVELGAQYLHGKHDIFYIAEREGMLVEEDSEEEELPDTLLQYTDFRFCLSDGTAVDKHTLRRNLQVLEDIQDASIEVPRKESAQDVSVSVGHLYRGMYPACRHSMQGSEGLKTAMFRWLETWECQDSGGTVDQLSLPGSGQYVFCPGHGTKETTGGIAEVFNHLLRDSVPPEHVRLNKVVKKIHWSADVILPADEEVSAGTTPSDDDLDRCSLPDGRQHSTDSLTVDPQRDARAAEGRHSDTLHPHPAEEHTDQTVSSNCQTSHRNPKDDYISERTASDYAVRIECEDGDIFYADHVIVTASMGVLKENPQLFVPPLPDRYRDAISSFGFGAITKAFLFWEGDEGTSLHHHPPSVSPPDDHWQRRMFGNDVEGVIPLWLDDVKPQFKSARYKETMSDGRQWWQDVCMLTPVRTHRCCIVAWAGGEAATVMETLPESEVKDVLHELLAFFLGKPELPAPSRLLRTKWHSNPHTRGAYSYLATGLPLDLHHLLPRPLPSPQRPVVQLAGEACSPHHYSTLHGALQSGRQAAQHILHHHNLPLS